MSAETRINQGISQLKKSIDTLKKEILPDASQLVQEMERHDDHLLEIARILLLYAQDFVGRDKSQDGQWQHLVNLLAEFKTDVSISILLLGSDETPDAKTLKYSKELVTKYNHAVSDFENKYSDMMELLKILLPNDCQGLLAEN